MTVSIITITRNNAAGLAETLRSVQAQTHRDIEHIIVDGMSTDDTPLVLARHAKGCRIISREPKGVYDAINHGLHEARGEVIALLHAGDTYARRDVVESIADAFSGTDAPDYLYGDVRIGNRPYIGRDASRKTLLGGFAPPHPSLAMTAPAHRHAGEYDPSFSIAGDFEMFLRLFFDDTLTGRYTPKVCVHMNPGGFSSKWHSRLITNNRERLRALRMHNLPASPLRLASHYLYTIKHKLFNNKDING